MAFCRYKYRWARWLVVGTALLATGCATAPRQKVSFASTPPPVAPPPTYANGSIYQQGHDLRLFEDLTARRVGDILTVNLIEKTNAEKKASTNFDKKSHSDLLDPTVFGKPVTYKGTNVLNTEVTSNHTFEGQGDSSQSNSLSGSVTVTVVEVLPNGNLRIQGEKRISINRGSEYVRLSGIVRPIDIAPDNSVPSTQVADATIVYTGDGEVADSNAAGWMMRFFVSNLWPF